ncbi:MAG: hypothetical protein ABI586_05290 [Candidatus Nanopelagicales bacterium]
MSPWSILHLLGGLGPGLAAVVVIALTEGHAGLRRIGRQLLARRGRGRAWAFAILVPPVLLLVAAPVVVMDRGTRTLLVGIWPINRIASLPLALWWIVNLLFYGVGEEVGRRGVLSAETGDATRSSPPQDW